MVVGYMTIVTKQPNYSWLANGSRGPRGPNWGGYFLDSIFNPSVNQCTGQLIPKHVQLLQKQKTKKQKTKLQHFVYNIYLLNYIPFLLLDCLVEVEVEVEVAPRFLFLVHVLWIHFCLSLLFPPYFGLSLQKMQILQSSEIFNVQG